MLTALTLGFRRLAKTPGFTFTALTTLAICLGANLTIFAVLDAIVLRSLPFPEPESLVLIENKYPGAGPGGGPQHVAASIPNYFDRRANLKSVSSLSIYQTGGITIGATGTTRRASIMRVSPDFFQTLGVRLAQGHTFGERELTYANDNVAIITDQFWRNYFAADPNVIGRTFVNDGLTTKVIGVLPPRFRFLSSKAEFFRPTSHALEDREPRNRHANNYTMIARLAAGATLANLQAELDALNAQLLASDPSALMIKGVGFHTTAYPLHKEYVRAIRPILLLLQCGVLFLFFIGCVNLMNLLLIRASHRAKEYAVRRALGARGRHLAIEILAETVLLAFGGSVYGLILGVLGIDFLHTLGTDRLPLGSQIYFDNRVGAIAFAITLFVAVALAVPVLTYVLRMKMAAGLQIESRGGTAGPGAQRLRHVFIVAQVALACVLLSSAGLLGASLHHVLSASPGFDTQHVVAGELSLPWKNYHTGSARLAFLERLIPAIKAVPGITAAAYTTELPFAAWSNSVVTIEGLGETPGQPMRGHVIAQVSEQYWKAMGIALLKGRFLTDADNRASSPVCVVDSPFADLYWPKGDALGRGIFVGPPRPGIKFSTVVGIVAPVKQQELTDSMARGAVYAPYVDGPSSDVFLVVRSALSPDTIGSEVRKVISDLDPELALSDWRIMQDRIDDTLVARKSPTILAAMFAATALLLAALGTYGVLSYAVTRREHEIGVRIALGAQPAQIRRQFLALGVRLLTVGAAVGLVGAWMAAQAMQSVLFESSSFNIDIFFLTFGVMALVSLAACSLPARRATKVDPAFSVRA